MLVPALHRLVSHMDSTWHHCSWASGPLFAGFLLVNSSAKNVARVCNIMRIILKFCIVKRTRMHFGYNLPFQAGWLFAGWQVPHIT
jgi:hypothetical protein